MGSGEGVAFGRLIGVMFFVGLSYGEGTPNMHGWLNEQETRLYQGLAGDIATTLRSEGESKPSVQEALSQEAGYFENNKRRLDYLEMRIQGWVIGISGRFDQIWQQIYNLPQN